MSNTGMGGHQSAVMKSDTWLTDPELLKKLGRFDLDPCTPAIMPWQTADHRYTKKEDGLKSEWFGRVWLNPPYSKEAVDWLRKLSEHGNGIALIFARTETKWFFETIWNKAGGILFIKNRLYFYKEDGTRGYANAGAPSCLVAYGRYNEEVLESEPVDGKYVPLNYTPLIVVGVSPSWINVVKIAIKHCGHDELKLVYDMVERIAPDKVQGNLHWKEKIRQKIQLIRKSR